MKLFANFMSVPLDYLLISWVMNYVRNLGFLTRSYQSETPLSHKFRA